MSALNYVPETSLKTCTEPRIHINSQNNFYHRKFYELYGRWKIDLAYSINVLTG